MNLLNLSRKNFLIFVPINIKNQRKLSFVRSFRFIGCEIGSSELNVATISLKEESGLKKVEAFSRILDR